MVSEKVLIVEDDKDLLKLLKYNIEKEGYRVVTANQGEQGLALFRTEKPNLIVLDVMLPKLDGFEFCRMVRSSSKTPIVMLTAKGEEMDRVLGLELGADDYVTKPFSIRELLARIRAILRRAREVAPTPTSIKAGDLEMDFEKFIVRLKSKSIAISGKEFDFLHILVEAKGKVLSREYLLGKIWGVDESTQVDTRTVDQHIARLRDKLGSEGHRIVTVHGRGYRFEVD